MTVPFEVFPIAGGALVGLLACWCVPRRWTYPLAVALSAVVAVTAFLLTGEFRVSLGFLVFDLGQAIGAAVAACALRDVAERRRPRRARTMGAADR